MFFELHRICILMKSRFVKDLNRLNIPDSAHVTVVNMLLHKSQHLKRSVCLPLLLILSWTQLLYDVSIKYGEMPSVQKHTSTTKNTQWPWQPTFHTASFLWQVHFSNYHARIKFYNNTSVNLPLTDEVSINTTFHPSEISGFLRNAIYPFAVLWCRTEKVASWLATFRFNILTPRSKIKQTK